jgi:hypothetical protein
MATEEDAIFVELPIEIRSDDELVADTERLTDRDGRP